jgi:putative flippase GtrA
VKRLVVLARSMLAGGAATLVDLGSLTVMVSLLGIAPRVASFPALANDLLARVVAMLTRPCR